MAKHSKKSDDVEPVEMEAAEPAPIAPEPTGPDADELRAAYESLAAEVSAIAQRVNAARVKVSLRDVVYKAAGVDPAEYDKLMADKLAAFKAWQDAEKQASQEG